MLWASFVGLYGQQLSGRQALLGEPALNICFVFFHAEGRTSGISLLGPLLVKEPFRNLGEPHRPDKVVRLLCSC